MELSLLKDGVVFNLLLTNILYCFKMFCTEQLIYVKRKKGD